MVCRKSFSRFHGHAAASAGRNLVSAAHPARRPTRHFRCGSDYPYPLDGSAPSIIEDQVTYPIVTTLLAAPHVKAVRAQTMFGDSYVFVIFEDTTDLYWARSRVLEYMQQITGRLPAAVHPVIGRMRPARDGSMNTRLWTAAIAVVWPTCTVFKIGIYDTARNCSWSCRGSHHRRICAPVSGQRRPDKLRAYGIPLSTVIERVRASTNELVGAFLKLVGPNTWFVDSAICVH